MWLEIEKFRELGEAICRGERKGLGRFMKELFHPENQYSLKMTVCPKCHKPLVGKMLPDLEYFVQACPDRHGAWMSPEVSAKVRDMVSRQFFISTRRWESLKLLAKCFAAGFCIIFLLNLSRASVKQIPSVAPALDIELEAGETSPPFDPAQSGIEDPHEQGYLSKILPLLEEGASNRAELSLFLKVRHAKNGYEKGFLDYLKKQRAFISRLRSVEVPARLNEFHQKIMNAAEAQTVFYAEWTKALEAGGGDYEAMLRHPALQACHRQLLEANDLFARTYPEANQQALMAVEKRLCWFDII